MQREIRMNTVVDAFEVRVVETVDTVVVEHEAPAIIITTLYDLMAAVQRAVAPGEEALVVPTVLHMLRAGRVTWLGDEAV
jgi:hypothetical protein